MTDLQSLTPELLRARRSLKWNAAPPDVLPMWVAEMDYPTAPVVTEALQRAVRNESFGYPLTAQASGLADAVAAGLHDRYAWTVDPAHVHVVADVLRGMALAIELFSEPHDGVILTTPVYMPFFDLVTLTGRPQVHVPMAELDGRAVLDLAGVERAFAEGARTLVLCNPYNPLGRVLDRSELTALADIVTRHAGRVISDEIHAPLVLTGEHIPYASLSPATAEHTVTVVSASKAWNLPGLKCAQVVLSNPVDDAAWGRLPLVATIGASTLGVEASIAAYRDGAGWLDEVCALLDVHAARVAEAVESWSGVRHRRNEGTYLAWLDCSEVELDTEPATWFLEHAQVMLSPGRPFRAPPRRFARLNFATTTALLDEGLGRIADALEKR